ncbi:MAG TPA: twin-arginine translocase subunit TatC [Steroidobacteraceae bacterium]|nr:twin-arginine translocase subunit TatC [Steroidobacteraceae bacterium]
MSEEPEEKLAEGTLISHLLELRTRLMRAAVAWVIALIPCAYYQNALFNFVAQPILHKLPPGTKLIATGVMSPFMTPFKLSMFVAIFAAMPFILYQIWAFVAPGLYRHERRFAVPLLVSSVVLFYTGMAFAYKFVFPVMFQFFAKTTPVGVTMMTDITNYLDFVLTMFFAFGVAFEVPIAVVLLVITGLVSLEKLKSNRGYVLIGIFCIAAILTPPDAISMTIMAVPMYGLYEGGLIMARIMLKMRREHEQEAAKAG